MLMMYDAIDTVYRIEVIKKNLQLSTAGIQMIAIGKYTKFGFIE